jgi:hypothetical protein
MCLKFQVHRSCNQGCYLANQPRSKMDPKDSKAVADKFVKLYA